jgi:hypothetical protein
MSSKKRKHSEEPVLDNEDWDESAEAALHGSFALNSLPCLNYPLFSAFLTFLA